MRGWGVADARQAPLVVSALAHVAGVRLHRLGVRDGADPEQRGGSAVPTGDVAVQPAAEQAAGAADEVGAAVIVAAPVALSAVGHW